MIDVTADPDGETPYECFQCGQIIVAETPPGRCPDCGGEIRNRRTPIE
ncbi:rubrerythrin-like domain-containing protein [Salinirubellus salinus]|uniref:Rubrerythrin-like domain-containing protein n=1 Tax=Salinirubellus salinus TaxID=1364945 RepID=A0A9E7U9M3_9EURY|nr:rubrerythrin-like domain-containing protein [Salinirubellus salinus]UWM53358.1 rubrerythrin-like domain-containing protein [Salinirubellus salinus]